MSGTRLNITRAPPAADDIEQAAARREPVVVLTSDKGRKSFLAMAHQLLPQGECLVETKDLASSRRSFETVPSDPRAVLVAETMPTKLRGTLVARVRYYRVPAGSLKAVETHRENGAFSHQYEVRLKPVVTGHAVADDVPALPA